MKPQLALPLLLGLFLHCTELGIELPGQEKQKGVSPALLGAALVALSASSDSGRNLNCAVTATAGSSTVTSQETLIIPTSTAFNLFKGDDARAQSAVYVVFDSATAGEAWLVKNFGSYPANSGEGTISGYTGNHCPLDTTSGGGRAAGTAITVGGGTGDRTITFNTAGAYIVQFYTGSGAGTGNGANATLQKN
ncbi:MAG: hypothetical protein HS115_03605 [Spirochaetales bacterium]|nr:hypothetical protein [Spirochaetales bacterium]